MSRNSSLTQSAHSVRQVLTAYIPLGWTGIPVTAPSRAPPHGRLEFEEPLLWVAGAKPNVDRHHDLIFEQIVGDFVDAVLLEKFQGAGKGAQCLNPGALVIVASGRSA